MQKGILFKDGNREQIKEMITKAENRASARCITYESIRDALSEVDDRLSVIGKKYQYGITVNVDINAQHFTSAYKGIPESTKFEAVRTSSGWKLTRVYRDRCRGCTQKIQMKFTQEAKDALIAAFENRGGTHEE